MPRFRTLLALLLLLSPGLLRAEPYPTATDPFVTDLADLLPAAEEESLRAELAVLKGETGIETSVVTIPSRDNYDPSTSIEEFATGLFNTWGIGDAARNDGILILVAADERAVRLELGKGYDQGYDVLAQDIVTRYFLPDFRENQMARGLVSGTRETVARIARRHARDLPAEALAPEEGTGSGFPWIPAALFAAGAGVLVLRRKRGAPVGPRTERCPNCGHVSLRTLDDAGKGGARRMHCPHCDYREERDIRARRLEDRDKGFGGGKSEGGGASGRW
ncbi:MAG: TPM domain-containing protein [Rhodobacteraceae bacterium]|nr:TPM domain-containing protein [Paracoccaceae bacterium]